VLSASPFFEEQRMKRPVWIILFLFSMVGLWQFSDGVRSVDVIGLFASGALAGVAIASFFMMKNNP
jgi:hypothetical protein